MNVACLLQISGLLYLCWLLTEATADTQSCGIERACGWMSVCNSSTQLCQCQSQDLVLHTSGYACRNASCVDTECLECDLPSSCIRCSAFQSDKTGLCLETCEGSSRKRDERLICIETEDSSDKDDDNKLVIAIVAGVGAGVLLCLILIIVFCCYIRRTRKKINLQSHTYTNRHMDAGHVKQISAFDNTAYEFDDPLGLTPTKIDPGEYQTMLSRLRPRTDQLMELLSQTRAKARSMSSSDPRLPTYKGVIHQLCRVLVLLHKKDPVVSPGNVSLSPSSNIPSDALGLLQWAQQMLDDGVQENSNNSQDYPVAQISAVDLQISTSPVYATPEDGQTSFSSTNQASPYSSVPVPVNTGNVHVAEDGYATVRRTPSIPKDTIMKYFEFTDLSVPRNPHESFTQNVNSQRFSNSSLVQKDDFQKLLINSPSNQVRHSNNLKNIPSNALESSVDSPSRVISPVNQVSSFQAPQPQKKNSINKNKKPNPPVPKKPVVPIKKNIITNPNIDRKKSKLQEIAQDNSIVGYFANGRYYEPNPRPMPDSEIYAPGSSYSDQSNIMSTFLGELPLSRTPSDASNGSSDSDVITALPFDPSDATEPVEV